MMQHRASVWTTMAVAGLMAVGCATARADSHESDVQQAVAVIMPTEGSDVSGVVHFYQTDEGVKIVADVSGLKPGQKHGFHIHQFGDMTAEDGTSAGGHYNPEGNKHGAPDSDERHAGDLGNLQANENGFAHYERVDDHITLTGEKNPILGRAVMVHAGEDTFVQPTGGAGSRLGFGVIGVANPED